MNGGGTVTEPKEHKRKLIFFWQSLPKKKAQFINWLDLLILCKYNSVLIISI